jgi:hypothetical protein
MDEPGGHEIERCEGISSRNILRRRRIRGQSDGPCHIVVAGNDEAIIVTVYNYAPEVYKVDHRRRTKQP